MIHHIIDFLMLCVFVSLNKNLIYLCGDLVFLTVQLLLFAVGFGGDRLLFWDYMFLLRHEWLAIGVICFCFCLEMTCMCLGMNIVPSTVRGWGWGIPRHTGLQMER